MNNKKCLNEETLTTYLAGSLEVGARTATEQHLVACDACRDRLVYYMRILDEDVHEEEEPVLEAAMSGWDMDRVPVPASGGRVAGYSLPVRLAFAASALIAVFLGAVVGLRHPPVPGSEEVLEAVLREERFWRARTSLQEDAEDYVTYLETRDAADRPGSGAGIFAGLLEGEYPGGAGMHLVGLRYLIERDFDRAVEYLREASRWLEDDPGVQNDVGLAYYVRPKDSPESEMEDFGLARTFFQNAIVLDRDFLPARFNLALLNLDEGMQAEARVQVEQYLDRDPDSGWALELASLME